jgi:hypothetical protein
VVAAGQLPLPLQARAEVSVEPVQVAVPQETPLAYTRQPPAPSQKPSLPQVEAPASVHWLRGSAPAGTLLQAPSEPATAHDLQVPVQAVAQQIPSSQKPERHSEAAPQAVLVGFLPQAPLTQTLGATQSASPVQPILQALVPQV